MEKTPGRVELKENVACVCDLYMLYNAIILPKRKGVVFAKARSIQEAPPLRPPGTPLQIFSKHNPLVPTFQGNALVSNDMGISRYYLKRYRTLRKRYDGV